MAQGFHSVNGFKCRLGLEVTAETLAFLLTHLLAHLLSK
jgi:hypothetical protein